jgi:hypothetical protein
MALCGGFMYSPTTSRTFASSSGSVENLNVATRQGCRSQSRHTFATVAKLIPSSLANSRLDQCVTPNLAGGLLSVATTTSLCDTTRGRPGRSRSTNAATPPA